MMDLVLPQKSVRNNIYKYMITNVFDKTVNIQSDIFDIECTSDA